MSGPLLVRDRVTGELYDPDVAARRLALARWRLYRRSVEQAEEEAGRGGTSGERPPPTTVGKSRVHAPASARFLKGGGS
jgi:hypothetical protein